MPAIRCKACGKTYDSREGFCPKCGAYNRPPRREWVDAGGDVHYAQQEKACYEQKECHEDPPPPVPYPVARTEEECRFRRDRRGDRGKRPDRAYQHAARCVR